jgi:hypothetical protein
MPRIGLVADRSQPQDIAMLSFFVALGCLGSIIQQIYYIVAWTSIKLEQHAALVEKAGTPAMTIGAL